MEVTLDEAGSTNATARFAIVSCCDQAQLPASCVALSTAKRNLSLPNVSFYVVAQGCEEQDFLNAAEYCSKNEIDIEVIPFDVNDNVGKSKGFLHISSAAYLRLYLDKLLPIDLARVLYLDADAIVAEDISEFLRMDLRGFPVAAVPEVYVETRKPFHYSEYLAIPENGYFNSGVLLFDWTNEVAKASFGKAREFIATNPPIGYHDQEALNVVFVLQWLRLDEKFNALSFSRSAGVRPVIAHFAGLEKPWLPNYYIRQLKYREVYKQLLQETSWSHFLRPKTILGWIIVLWEPVIWWQQRRIGLAHRKMPLPPGHRAQQKSPSSQNAKL